MNSNVRADGHPGAVSAPQRSSDVFASGEYLRKNPGWHVEESPWKARQIVKMLEKHNLKPQRICEIGCGAGEVLVQLQILLAPECFFEGFDTSAQAIQMCQSRANGKLHFTLSDGLDQPSFGFDLTLVLDVFEHVEDYFTFLRNIRDKGRLTIFHIPLDLSVQTVFRKYGLLKRRDLYFHLHYFTKDTALRTLEEVGYRIIDYSFTPRNLDNPSNMMHWILKLPRQIGFAINKEFTVRLLGGYSLLVLANGEEKL
jgi:cyclopropane fatty-acyl-phospholipid synthase-like methyltransferase